MPVPILCLDEALQHFAQRCREAFSKPQYQHFVTVLRGLMLCESRRTLSGLVRQIAAGPSLAGLSRFLAEAPWEATAVVERWLRHFHERMQPVVAAELQRGRQAQPSQRGRPKPAVVTGDLIGDDSTIEKRQGKKREGVGLHQATTQDKPVHGHRLLESLEVLGGRGWPLAAPCYRQRAVGEAEGVPFPRNIDLMQAVRRTFEPVAGTLRQVLLDNWYGAKAIWRAARERGFLITSGLKSNRWLRIEDPTVPKGGAWQRRWDYTAKLSASDYVQIKWPKGDEEVYVHVVTTRVRKLYSCHGVSVRQSVDAPVSQARSGASSDLEARPQLLLTPLAARWASEGRFGEGTEERGLDHDQLMRALAIGRFWTLAMLAYVLLQEEPHRLQSQWQRPVTRGEARREIQPRPRRHLLDWLDGQFQSGIEPDSLL